MPCGMLLGRAQLGQCLVFGMGWTLGGCRTVLQHFGSVRHTTLCGLIENTKLYDKYRSSRGIEGTGI